MMYPMMMYDVRLAIGCNVGGIPTLSVDDIVNALTDIGLQGATITQAVGFWQGDYENTVIVEICAVSGEEADAWTDYASYLCDVLQQDAIMLDYAPSNVQFIS